MSNRRKLNATERTLRSYRHDWRMRGGRRINQPATNSVTVLRECRSFFTADTAYGLAGVSISVPVASGVSLASGAVAHALSLGIVEEKILFIENWLRCALDLDRAIPYTGTDTEAPAYTKLFTITDNTKKGVKVSLFLPVKYLHLIPAFSDSDFPSSWTLDWAVYPATFRLSHMTFQDEEVPMINEDALILIPESFASSWAIQMQIPALNRVLEGVYDADKGMIAEWQIAGDSVSRENDELIEELPGNTNTLAISGSVEYFEHVPIKLLIPTQRGDAHMMGEYLTNLMVRLQTSSGETFLGNIGPVASGYGFYVNKEVMA